MIRITFPRRWWQLRPYVQEIQRPDWMTDEEELTMMLREARRALPRCQVEWISDR